MALTILQHLQVLNPAYSTDPDVNLVIEAAQERVNVKWYGLKSNQAVALMTAHMMATRPTGLRQYGEGGAITSKSEGDLSIGFATPTVSSGDADLSQSVYGLRLISLRRGCGPFMGVAAGPAVLPPIIGGFNE